MTARCTRCPSPTGHRSAWAAWRPATPACRTPTYRVLPSRWTARTGPWLDAIPVGTVAAVALIEHLWATPLREAIDRAGGRALDETWLDREDVERLERLIARQGG